MEVSAILEMGEASETVFIRTLTELSHATGESVQDLAAYTDSDIAEVFQQFKVDVIGRNKIAREIQAVRVQSSGGAMPSVPLASVAQFGGALPSAPVAVAQAVVVSEVAVPTLESQVVCPDGWFVTCDADFEGGDSGSMRCETTTQADAAVLQKSGDSTTAFQYYAPHNKLYTKPVGRNAKWTGRHQPYNLYVWGKDTGHRAGAKMLIMLNGVDCCFGDGEVKTNVACNEDALAQVVSWQRTGSAAFWHRPSRRLIEKPKDRGSKWTKGDGTLFMWVDRYVGPGQHGAQAPTPMAMNRSFNNPPSSDHSIHPEGNNFFWRYFTGDEGCVCEHGACCKVALCGACLHGEITEWTTGQNKCLEWALCPCMIPCMIEADRRAIEAKIHNFHAERGDPSAEPQPFRHEGACICALFCGWPMAAQNYLVMKNFQATQKEYL